MNGSPLDLDDHGLAAELAAQAASLLLRLRREAGPAREGLGARADRAAHELICRRLAQARPHDAVLSEEGVHDGERLARARVWIVDPLDGTREFAEGRDDWAVHVALSEQGVPAACAVALPALGLAFDTGAPPPVPARSGGPLRIVVSRTRAPALARQVAQTLGAEVVPMGSAGAKAMAVVRGQADAYLHAGGQYEWDSCAPVGVALAAGLHASRIDGSALRYNRTDLSVPDLLVCRRELAPRLLQAIRDALAAPSTAG